MGRFAFLDTSAAPAARFAPQARSSLAHRHRVAEARLEARDGWLVPASYPHEDRFTRTVAVVDVSHIGKLDVSADRAPDEEAALDVCQTGPGRFAVLCRFRDLAPLRERIEQDADWVLDRTSAWAALLLVGPAAEPLLRRLTPLEQPPGRGPIGAVPGTVLVRPGGFCLVFSQEYAQYVWDLALDLAEPLGGGPAGVDAVSGDPLAA